MRIERFTPEDYQEVSVSPFALEGAHGLHPVLPTENGYWIVYPTEKTTQWLAFDGSKAS